jgi:hypothetical protein
MVRSRDGLGFRSGRVTDDAAGGRVGRSPKGDWRHAPLPRAGHRGSLPLIGEGGNAEMTSPFAMR